jgi:LacI family transcriptional regulator
MTKLKDVSDITGLSISTISYVLNGKKKVKKETYEKIMKAVENTSYIPNQLARGLKTKVTFTIGVIIPDIANEFFPEIVKGIDDMANKYNYSIILCNTDNDVNREKKSVNTLLSKDIDGIIFIGTAKSHTILESKTNLPIIMVDRSLGGKYSSVVTDNYRGGYMAAEYLIGLGRKTIALLSGPAIIQNFFDRIKGYRDALRDNNIHYREDYAIDCEFTIKSGYDGTLALYKKQARVDAIFAANDLIALGAIRALKEIGKAIPDEVAVVGFDDIALASMSVPSLTTIKQAKYEMGQRSAELLINRIHDKTIAPEHIVLAPILVQRESA